jgi:hypothetical protein
MNIPFQFPADLRRRFERNDNPASSRQDDPRMIKMLSECGPLTSPGMEASFELTLFRQVVI